MQALDESTIRYRSMRDYIARIQQAYRRCDENDSGESLVEALSIQLHNLYLQMTGLPAGLDSLPLFNRGVRLAGVLMEAIQETQSTDMGTWRWGDDPVNSTQRLYSVLQQLSYDLSAKVWTIEAEHPHRAPQFAQERREYLAAHQLLKALDRSKYFSMAQTFQ